MSPATNGDACESLIDMHRIELLSVGSKTNYVVVGKYFAYRVFDASARMF